MEGHYESRSCVLAAGTSEGTAGAGFPRFSPPPGGSSAFSPTLSFFWTTEPVTCPPAKGAVFSVYRGRSPGTAGDVGRPRAGAGSSHACHLGDFRSGRAPPWSGRREAGHPDPDRQPGAVPAYGLGRGYPEIDLAPRPGPWASDHGTGWPAMFASGSPGQPFFPGPRRPWTARREPGAPGLEPPMAVDVRPEVLVQKQAACPRSPRSVRSANDLRWNRWPSPPVARPRQGGPAGRGWTRSRRDRGAPRRTFRYGYVVTGTGRTGWSR